MAEAAPEAPGVGLTEETTPVQEEHGEERRSRGSRRRREPGLFSDAPAAQSRGRAARLPSSVDSAIAPVSRAEWQATWRESAPAVAQLREGSLRPTMPGSGRSSRGRGGGRGRENARERVIAAEVPSSLGIGDLQTQRVTQLDGKQLDDEVESLLYLQLKRAFRFFSPSAVSFYQPELKLLLRLALFRAAMWPWHTTYGMRLQNLSYRNEWWHGDGLVGRLLRKVIPTVLLKPPSRVAELGLPRTDKFVSTPLTHRRHAALSRLQLLLYVVGWIGGRYIVQRLMLLSSVRGWSEEEQGSAKLAIWQLLHILEKVSSLVEFVSFTVFLFQGRYQSIVARVLGMRLVSASRTLPRQVSFEYMNRQLVWQGFTEFLMFLLPLLDISGWKKTVQQWIRGPARKSLPAGTCPICSASPINTQYLTDCNHSFCYYCLSTAMLEDPAFCCLRCGHKVRSIRRSKSV